MNLPNKLTVARVMMVPLFVVAFLMESVSDWVALVLFVAAGITDLLDGMLARKYNMVTNFGKLMDPLADKLMVMSALVCFTAYDLVNPAVTVIILAREFLVTGLRMLATTNGKVIAADIWGKLKTVAQDTGIILILAWQALEHTPLSTVLKIASTVCIWVMTVLTVVSAVNYCVKNASLFKDE